MNVCPIQANDIHLDDSLALLQGYAMFSYVSLKAQIRKHTYAWSWTLLFTCIDAFNTKRVAKFTDRLELIST